MAPALWQSLEDKERREKALVQRWEYSDTSRPLVFSFHHFNDFLNSRNVFMPLHDWKMLFSHEEPWAKTYPESSQEQGLLSEQGGHEPGWQLSLVGPRGRLRGVCRFVNYHSVFMGRALAVFVGTEPGF